MTGFVVDAPYVGYSRSLPRTAGMSLLDGLFAITLASLFLGFYYPTPLGKLRPFDGLTLLLLLSAVSKGVVLRVPRAMLPALVFLAIHVVSATTVSVTNGFREAVQATTASMFVITLVSYLATRDPRPFLRAFIVLVLGLVAYSVAWHLAQGLYVGWKRLGDPKTAFLLLPAVACSTVAQPGNRGKLWPWLFAATVFVAIALSGERKAYLVAATAFLVMVRTTGRMRWLTIAALVAATMAGIVTADPTGYLARQVDSLTNLGLGGDEGWLSANSGASLSNMQRAFALQIGFESLQESPWFGVGTNAYVDFMNARFDALPEYLQLGIHGEFLRVLVENGLVGFIVYVTAWIVAAKQLLRLRRTSSTPHARLTFQVSTILFVACLAYCTFEGSKTLSIVAVLVAPVVSRLAPQVTAIAARSVVPR